jgi:class 3 adenylate cyclase
MPEIFVWPDEVSVPLVEGDTLLAMAVDAGLPIAHLCGGRARCSTCRIRVVEGLDALSNRTEEEAAMAERLDFPDEVRLACQTHADGEVRFWRLVLDKVDLEMASQLGRAHYAGPVGREVERAAVMFTDVAGFTSMSEALPAYDVVHILNRFFNRVEAAVQTEGGRVDNYMGDGLLAVFGIEGEGDAPLGAVRAGLGVLEIAADINDYVSMIYGRTFQVRVGISLGEVIFGLMGGEASARETVVGDVVNTASRLEAANKTTGTKILVSEGIQTETVDSVDYGPQLKLELSGKAGQITAYEVMGLTELPGETR